MRKLSGRPYLFNHKPTMMSVRERAESIAKQFLSTRRATCDIGFRSKDNLHPDEQ